MTKILRAIVALFLSEHVHDLVAEAEAMVTAVDADKVNFPNLAALLASILAAVAELKSAAGKVKDGVHGAAQVQEVKKEALKILLHDLGQEVQKVANALPRGEGEGLILGVHMHVDHHPPRQKQKNEAKQLPASGEVELFAEVVPHATSFEWQSSTTNNKADFAYLRVTSESRTVVTNLTPGQWRWFRSKPVLTHGASADWCEGFSILVK